MSQKALRIQFVGSGDAFGSGGRFQACILLDFGGFRALLDCGASSLIALKQAAIDPNCIDAILISHLHGDHFGGLPFFVLDAQFAHRSQNLLIAGPPGIEERAMQAAEVLFPGSSRKRREFETVYRELAKGNATPIGPMRVTPHEVAHSSGAPSYGLRVEIEDRVVAYSGDTGWTEELIPLSTGADLFICETSFYDKQLPSHLDYKTLMKHRSRLGCKRLILTHMSPDMLARSSEVPIETAHDGMEVLL